MPIAAGSPNLFFARETRVYLEQGSNLWEIPVLNGFTYSQAEASTDVALNEAADSSGNSRRARRTFTDALNAAEWSFSTYARPFLASSKMRAIEEPLWANFVAPNSYVPATPAWNSDVSLGAASLDIDFLGSNKTQLGIFNLYFVLGAASYGAVNYAADGSTTIYKVTGAVINEATLNFELAGITTIAWSGMGATLQEVSSLDATNAIRGGVDQTGNFIRNKLTQLNAVSSVSGSSKTYLITLTGGSITITNGITFLTPEVLGRVNTPLGHVTGTRTVSGTFTAYMDEKTNGSIDLFDDLSHATNLITNSFALDFYVGGKSATDLPNGPGMQFKFPNAHVLIPTFNLSDIVSTEVSFNALPSTISAADEITRISYVGV